MYITKIKNIYPELTGSEMKIADYILANKGNIDKITSSELAEILEVGQSTIIRFSQKLGYKTFKQFVNDMANDTGEADEANGEVQLQDSTRITMEKIKERYKELLDIAYDLNTDQEFEAVMRSIQKAEHILVYGFLGTGSIASYLSNSLIEMGFYSIYSSSVIEMKQRISLGNEKDILVLISKTGETKEVIRLAEIAKKKGIQVIAITNMTKNSLSTLSDLQLKILSSRVKTRLQAYASSVELIYVIDSLILLLYKADYAKYRGKVEKYIEVVREKQE